MILPLSVPLLRNSVRRTWAERLQGIRAHGRGFLNLFSSLLIYISVHSPKTLAFEENFFVFFYLHVYFITIKSLRDISEKKGEPFANVLTGKYLLADIEEMGINDIEEINQIKNKLQII